jgi:adenylosuccinate lyase
MLGYSVVAMDYVLRGLNSIKADEAKCASDLAANPKVLTEAIQIAGRMTGAKDLYTKLRDLTRNDQPISWQDLRLFIGDEIPNTIVQDRLLALTPATYIGIAPRITEECVTKYRNVSAWLRKRI